MNFTIKKDSTLPELKLPLTAYLLKKYGIDSQMMKSVGVTFSMIESETGLYRIANVPATLIVNSNDDEVKYDLVYNFKLSQTSKSGRYLGEFKLDFFGTNLGGKITLPTNGYINIQISDSFTKTSIV